MKLTRHVLRLLRHRGGGTIDGAGAYWWPRASRALNKGAGRPHLLELQKYGCRTRTAPPSLCAWPGVLARTLA